MANWFQTQDPQFQPRDPSDIYEGARRGTVVGGRAQPGEPVLRIPEGSRPVQLPPGYSQMPTGYANPTVFGGYDPQTGQYNTQPQGGAPSPGLPYAGGQTPPPPGGPTQAWWNSLSPQEQAWRQSQATDRGGWGQRPPPPPDQRYGQQMPGSPPPGGAGALWPLAALARRGLMPPGFGAAPLYPTPQPGAASGQAAHVYPTPGGTGGGTVMLRAPTGQMRSVPAAQAAFYLARGASKV